MLQNHQNFKICYQLLFIIAEHISLPSDHKLTMTFCIEVENILSQS
jgi:hypothetical protein